VPSSEKLSFNKNPTSIEVQIDQMAARGLKIKDRDVLRRELQTIGYYRLSGYWLHFEEIAGENTTRSKKFKPGTRHEDITSLYIFDRKLRLIVMEAIERLEIALRASWVHNLAMEGGSHAFAHAQNFNDEKNHQERLLRLREAVKKSQETFISHYKRKYDRPADPPIWASAELLTIGELSKWYNITKETSIRAAIASDLGISSTDHMRSILQVLSLVRNICAHHGRLWNRQTTKRLPVFKEAKSYLVMDRKQKATPQNSLYNVLVACIIMLRKQSPRTTYASRVATLVRESTTMRQRVAMGFPSDWQKRDLWHLGMD
jgi:abortive infection bacteriophage resistance protein